MPPLPAGLWDDPTPDEHHEYINFYKSYFAVYDPADDIITIQSYDYDCDCTDWTDFSYISHDYITNCTISPAEIGEKITIDPVFEINHEIYAVENCPGRCYFTNNDGKIGQESGGTKWHRAILRFPTDQFPFGIVTRIRKARLAFTSAANSTGTGSLNLHVKALTSPYQNTDFATNPTSWNAVPHWSTSGTYYSPDISCLINYIFNEQAPFNYREPIDTGGSGYFTPPHDLMLLVDSASVTFGGSADQIRRYSDVKLELWYSTDHHITSSGGAVCGGSATVSTVANNTTSGGVVGGGSAVVVRIPLSPQIIGDGGYRIGGSADHELIPLALHTHKVLLTVPAGRTSTTLHNFLLGINVTIDPEKLDKKVKVTDMDDNKLWHHVRTLDPVTGQVILFVKATITPDGWSGWLYYGGNE